MTQADHEALRVRMEALLARVTYKKGYRFLLEVDKTNPQGRLYVQVECERPDVFTGLPGVGHGGKYYLSPHMTDSEISRALMGLLLAYEEHEAREFYKIDGVAPYGPHIALEALLVAATQYDFRAEQ